MFNARQTMKVGPSARLSGAATKPPLAAAIKSCGSEHEGKGMITCQVRIKKTNKREPSSEASKGLDDVKTKVQYLLWEEQQGYLITVAAASGV